jgi:hypothetical protein
MVIALLRTPRTANIVYDIASTSSRLRFSGLTAGIDGNQLPPALAVRTNGALARWISHTAPLLALLIGTFSLVTGTGFVFAEEIRKVPSKEVPVGVSLQARAMIYAPLDPRWNTHPKGAAEWKEMVKKSAEKRS